MAEFNELELIPFRSRKRDAIWLDVNTKARQNGQPDLLPNIQAINNAIRNLFGCPIGSRGPIFRPTYGTFLIRLLQEPIDAITAQKIRASSIQSLQKWEPRVRIIPQQTFVVPHYDVAGYLVRIAYVYLTTNEVKNYTFFLKQ
jgi:phage baseplate assembly protein W